MKLCILNSTTKVCENIVNADSIESFVPYKMGIEVIANDDGQIGWEWSGTSWVTNEIALTEEQIIFASRTKRNNLLKQTVDRINPIRWESYTQEQKDAWVAYRQALLDIPQQDGYPNNIIWPLKPE